MERALWEISKKVIVSNVKEIARFAGKRVIAVVKADAYGHGAVEVARLLEPLKEVELFAVSCPREGAELREAGVKKPILLLAGFFPEELRTVVEYKLTPVVSDRLQLREVVRRKIPYHLNLDTGMGRLGFRKLPSGLIKTFSPQGVMTHFPSAELDEEFTKRQIREFYKVVKALRVRYIHLQNTAGLAYSVPYANLVRVGLAVYGEYSGERLKRSSLRLSFPSKVKARILEVRRLPKGSCISYGCRFKLKRSSFIGVITMGYADGLRRDLFGKLSVFYRGRAFPVVGNITMDLAAVDFGNLKPAVGDYVELVNPERKFSELAKLVGTIPYELMTSLGERVRRTFKD